MLNIAIIVGSTREGRFGIKPALWIKGLAEKRPDWKVDFLDLKEIDLPFFTEPGHPAKRESFTNAKAAQWSQSIAKADAYIVVTPEYNHSPNAALKNAIDWLNKEWAEKPIAFVSYGGVSAGTRAVEQLRLIAIEVHMAPIREAVHFSLMFQKFNESGEPEDARLNDKAEIMFKELTWWGEALKAAREKK